MTFSAVLNMADSCYPGVQCFFCQQVVEGGRNRVWVNERYAWCLWMERGGLWRFRRGKEKQRWGRQLTEYPFQWVWEVKWISWGCVCVWFVLFLWSSLVTSHSTDLTSSVCCLGPFPLPEKISSHSDQPAFPIHSLTIATWSPLPLESLVFLLSPDLVLWYLSCPSYFCI